MKKKHLITIIVSSIALSVIAVTLFAFILPELSQTAPHITTASDSEPIDTEASKKENTLMIYMIGSDLEAQGGLGTKDLEEIKESGVDLNSTTILVYAGGSGRWHNDIVSDDKKHSLLLLGQNGFENIRTFDDASMGEVQTFTDFLNYSYENFPAEKYSLILWNHGNGPLKGYGSDMLYGDDALTLAEMKKALDASPFCKNNKLSFVGFDACLMSSAELCCIWSDFADYLIASQEIEPSFGWNYSFVKELGKDTPDLAQSILSTYLLNCEEYFERKGFNNRDTTLACMDLSKTSQLKQAVNNLFSCAAESIDTSYVRLASNRVNTRALGRASTGSEYDLVDLYDLATRMSTDYPQECDALIKAIESMVIGNATNAENLCGISLYYPFYNKNHYEKAWGNIYKDLNVFPEYNSYIDLYTKQWLSEDMLELSAVKVTPELKDNKEFTLKLTDNQTETYVSSRYYILRRDGDELYAPIFSSSNIEKNGNNLTANFGNQILYVKNKYDYIVPVTIEYDTVGDLTRYSAEVTLSNELPSFPYVPETFELTNKDYRFHLVLNNKTKEITTSALVPFDKQVATEDLTGGKLEDTDLSEWATYSFLYGSSVYISRYPNGTVKPVSQWSSSGAISFSYSRINDGLEFVYAPLDAGEYALIFEIEDAQGNKYCSEPINFTSDEHLKPEKERELIETVWEDNSEKALLLKEKNIELYLTSIDKTDFSDFESPEGKQYAIEVVNNNDYAIYVSGGNLMYNNEVYCGKDSISSYLGDDSLCSFTVEANSTKTSPWGFDFTDAQDLDIIKNIDSLQFTLNVFTQKNDRTIINKQDFSVKLGKSKSDFIFEYTWDIEYYERDKETRSILAQSQVLYNKNDMKITLEALGGNGKANGHLVAHFIYQNTSDQNKYLCFDNLILDGISIKDQIIGTKVVTIPANSTVHKAFVFTEEELDANMIDSPKSVLARFRFASRQTIDGLGAFSDPFTCNVTLKKTGKGIEFKEGNEILYDENGLRITLVKSEVLKASDTTYWYLAVSNSSGKDIYIEFSQKFSSENGETYLYSILDTRLGNKEKRVIDYSDPYGTDNRELYLRVTDYNNEKILWESTTPITLNKVR